MTKLDKQLLDFFNDKVGFTHNIDEIDLSTDLSDMGLDSLDVIEVLMEVENHFNITIDDKHFDTYFTNKKNVNIRDIKIFLRQYGILDLKDERMLKIKKIEG